MVKRIIQQMVKQKVNQLTTTELIQYGKQYGFTLTKAEAEKILKYIRSKSLDPFKEEDRLKLLKKIAQITDDQTAKKAHKLFKDMIKQYGMEDMF